MPTVFTHPVVAVGLSPAISSKEKRLQIIVLAMLLSILPDIDVIGFKLGIPYLHLFGHRGFTHSLFFAVTFSGLIAWLVVRKSDISFIPIWIYFSLCMASHGLLDAMTNGGYGIAFFSPFTNERYFFDYHPIEVSTLSIQRFFEGQGYGVIMSELNLVWLPAAVIFITLLAFKKMRG